MTTKLQYKDLLVELKFVKKIPENKIVNTKRHTFQERGTWLTTIVREWDGQSREVTLDWLQNLINQTSTALINLKGYERDTLVKVFAESVPGIENLVHTYNDDVYVSCKLEALYEEAKELAQKYGGNIETVNAERAEGRPTERKTVREDNYYDE